MTLDRRRHEADFGRAPKRGDFVGGQIGRESVDGFERADRVSAELAGLPNHA
jgi:hypothetical protein